MIDEVKVNGVDVTLKRRNWHHEEEWNIAIDAATLVFSPSLKTTIPTLSTGMAVTIKRGFVDVSEDFVFDGIITQKIETTDEIVLECKGRLYDCIKNGRTKSWDRGIDPEGGVGSEIVKDILDQSSLPYDGTSIVSTGTDESDRIQKFIQRDEDDYDRLNLIAEKYRFVLRWNADDQLTEFKPIGFTTYPVTLNVGTEIPSNPVWTENMEQLINRVQINGVTEFDTRVESFAGPASTFTLNFVPEQTEVTVGGVLQKRGQKNQGIIGTDFDYYVDTVRKEVVFSSSKSTVVVTYGAQVPLPVIIEEPTSITTYGGPNAIPHFKKFFFNDIIDLADAEARANEILDIYSTPFIEADNIPVKNSTIQTNGFIEPGMVVDLNDSTTGVACECFVKKVVKEFPHVTDQIWVGDEIYRTEDWQATQMKKINQIFNALNQNADFLIQIVVFTHEVQMAHRFVDVIKVDKSGIDTGIYNQDGISQYGAVKYASSTATYPTTTERRIWSQSDYEEKFVDNLLIGPGTAELDLTNNVLK